MTKPLLLTEMEAADHLRLSIRTLRKARQEGTLRYVLIGRAVRYTVDDLESFVDSHRKVSAPCPKPDLGPRSRARSCKAAAIIPFTARNANG